MSFYKFLSASASFYQFLLVSIAFLIFLSVSGLLFTPHSILAAVTIDDIGTAPSAQQLGITPSPVNNANDITRVVVNATKGFYISFFILAVLFLVIAAYKYLFSGGDPVKIKSAKHSLIYALVGLALALLAVSFEPLIKNFLQGDDHSYDNIEDLRARRPANP